MTARTRNILKGIGSVMVICPPPKRIAVSLSYTPPSADQKNLRADMERIGKDFYRAMDIVSGQENKT